MERAERPPASQYIPYPGGREAGSGRKKAAAVEGSGSGRKEEIVVRVAYDRSQRQTRRKTKDVKKALTSPLKNIQIELSFDLCDDGSAFSSSGERLKNNVAFVVPCDL